MKPKYPITLALSEEEKEAVEKLKEKGVKLIDIFRKGLWKCLEEESKRD